jgi:hypothetical protein
MINQKADEPHRCARVGCNECDSKDQRATVAPAKKMLRRDSLPMTLDDWHRAQISTLRGFLSKLLTAALIFDRCRPKH